MFVFVAIGFTERVDEVRDKFCNDVRKVLAKVDNRDILDVMGDINELYGSIVRKDIIDGLEFQVKMKMKESTRFMFLKKIMYCVGAIRISSINIYSSSLWWPEVKTE